APTRQRGSGRRQRDLQ
ncbi:ostA-like family protein, partial [Vibrio parahaemolyticus VPTS-2010_2]